MLLGLSTISKSSENGGSTSATQSEAGLPETSSSVVCGAKERTDAGAELGTDDLVGADFGAVRTEFRTNIAPP